jgi:dolichol-phosphate mannosyltransferase
MSEGADVVYGQRTDRVGETLFKTRTAKLFYRMLDRITHVRIPLDAGDFKLMRRSVVDALNAMPEQQRFIRGMVAWLGFRQVAIPYRRDARFAGETKYPLRRMISFALDGVTGFSIAPLRLTTWLGFLFCLFALASSAYALIAWATSSAVHGWTSILVVTSLVGGVQLICLGIVGEYLGRIYLETKRRPNYIVREIRGRPHAAGQPRTHPDSSRRVASSSR